MCLGLLCYNEIGYVSAVKRLPKNPRIIFVSRLDKNNKKIFYLNPRNGKILTGTQGIVEIKSPYNANDEGHSVGLPPVLDFDMPSNLSSDWMSMSDFDLPPEQAADQTTKQDEQGTDGEIIPKMLTPQLRFKMGL